MRVLGSMGAVVVICAVCAMRLTLAEVDAGDGFECFLDVDLAGRAGHALNAQRLLAGAALRLLSHAVERVHAPADSTNAG